MFLINPYILQATGNPLWDGLLAYYTADNTPNDALGNYNGTLVNGATYGTGIINQGFSFDGVNDNIAISSLNYTNTTTPISISCWINSSGTGGTIVQNLFNNTTGYQLYLFGGNVKFRVSSGSFPNELRKELTSAISTSTWYHVVVTYDGSADVSGVKIYLNATEPASSNTYNACSSTSLTSVSTIIGGTNAFFNGILDEVGIWNRELTSTEVTELYNSGAGKQYPN